MSDLSKSNTGVSGIPTGARRSALIDLILLAVRPQEVPGDSAVAVWIRAHPNISLVGLAYGLTWIGLIPLILNPALQLNLDHLSPSVLLVAFFGTLGCLWAGTIVASATSGAAGRKALLRGYLQWRAPFQWYLVVLLGPSIVWLAAIGLDFVLTGQLPAVPALHLLPFTLLSSYAFYLVRYMFGNFEEICWRASLLPRMQGRHGALTASLIIGVIQGLWHLPYAFVRGSFVQAIGLPAMILLSVAMGVVLTWVYNSTRGSLLLVALFHAAFDAWSPFQGTDVRLAYVMILAWAVLAIGIAGLVRARGLSRREETVRA